MAKAAGTKRRDFMEESYDERKPAGKKSVKKQNGSSCGCGIRKNGMRGK